MNGHNVFAGAFVDRSGHRRRDLEWLKRVVSGPDARFLPVWRENCLACDEPPRITLLGHEEVDAFLDWQGAIFLGMYRDEPVFALALDNDADPPLKAAGQYHDLRYLGSVLPPDEANLAAHARALVTWHGRQRFCSICGSETRSESAGNTRVCVNAACGEQIFPRVDPAIIVLVERGDRCLLGRQTSWPDGRYSTIAGFVEPGESLEDAVRREVSEETDIAVGEVRYHSSQPWPFPASLMLGFTATATSEEIQLNDGELEDARWFTRKECRSGFPKLPFRPSIARRLVDDWLAGDR